MNKILIVLILFSSSLSAQKGVIQKETGTSKILKREMTYSVYLPPSYETSNRSYPILYLLHGMTGDYSDWVNRGEVATITNTAIERGAAPEMIIIMPDGLFDAFYQNNFDGSLKWEDYFINELMPEAESKFRVHAKKTYRSIAGLSMGGYGSVYMSLKHPKLFSTCYAMSGAFIELEPVKKGEKADSIFEELYVKIWGKRNAAGLPETYKENSILEMVRAMDEYKAPTSWRDADKALPLFVLDCGDDDSLLKFNFNLFEAMKEKKMTVDFRVKEGSHNWTYWRECLPNSLTFAGKTFRD